MRLEGKRNRGGKRDRGRKESRRDRDARREGIDSALISDE